MSEPKTTLAFWVPFAIVFFLVWLFASDEPSAPPSDEDDDYFGL